MTQPIKKILTLAVALSLGCAGNSSNTIPLISLDPVGAVRQFMSAVQRNDLTALSSLWGTADGLAADKMGATQLEQRLTVMQRYLVSEEYEVLEAGPSQGLGGLAGEQYLRVRLSRNNCEPIVPVTLVQFSGGWIVKAVDLSLAGNPQRAC